MKFWSRFAMIVLAVAIMASCDHLHGIDDSLKAIVQSGEHR
jgi:hypothetical protein